MLLPSAYLGTSTTNKHSVNLPFKCLMENAQIVSLRSLTAVKNPSEIGGQDGK